jgi:hypothetical protein
MVQWNDHYCPLEVMYVVEDMVNPPTQARSFDRYS